MSNVKDAQKVSVEEAMQAAGMSLMDCVFDSIVPACCSFGCEVEPDGTCEHGFPSVLVAEGLI